MSSLSILSYHHFQEHRLALSEMMRVAGAGPLVFFTFYPERLSSFWLPTIFLQCLPTPVHVL